MILHCDPSSWPKVDFLIAFYSHGFPLQKAGQYVRLTGVTEISDVRNQGLFHSRAEIYRLLARAGVRVPDHTIVDHSKSKVRLEESTLWVGDRQLPRPFVEKPLDAENHNVWIYLADGTCRKLMRKVGDVSSILDTCQTTVRTDGQYIYERMLETNGEDVKVYMMGEYYYAESRKAPTIDGRVERTAEGREKRCEVDLTPQELEYCRSIGATFKQFCVGFDILRCTDGQSYVCDVNCWSFVKGNMSYYDEAARQILSKIKQLKSDRCNGH